MNYDNDIIKYTENLLKNIGFPARPKVLLSVQEEISKEDPDISKIADLVEKDVSLSAMSLKVANSPAFAGGNIEAIDHAIMMLGTKNFYNIVLSVALKNALSKHDIDKEFFELFWAHTEAVSLVCRHVGQYVGCSDKLAYMTGLFHDCAIPLLQKRFGDYSKVLKLALSVKYCVVEIENDTYKTNHSIAGHVIAKSWDLPNTVAKAIQFHHYPDIDIYEMPEARKLGAVLSLSEALVYAGSMGDNVGNYELEPNWNVPLGSSVDTKFSVENDVRWEKILAELGIDENDIHDIQDHISLV